MKNTHNRNKKLMLLSIIKSAKFMKKVIPGDNLSLEVYLLKYRLKVIYYLSFNNIC